MYSTGSTGFGLHFNDFRNDAPEVLFALNGPFFGQFPHHGRRGNRVDRNDFAGSIGDRRSSFIPINSDLTFFNHNTPLFIPFCSGCIILFYMSFKPPI